MEHAAAASKLVTEGEREIRENAADSSATDYSSVTSEESQKHRSADIRAASASRTVRGQRCGAEVEGGGRRPRRQLKSMEMGQRAAKPMVMMMMMRGDDARALRGTEHSRSLGA